MMGSDAVSAQVQRRRVHLPALIGAVALTVVALLLVAAAPALADDNTAPQVTAFSLSPETVDTTLGEQTVTATATITDAGTGVKDAYISLQGGGQSDFSGFSRVSGDAHSGAYVATLTLPWGSAPGSWEAHLDLYDLANNSRMVFAPELDAAFGAGAAEITNAATFWDTSAPQVTAFNLAPQMVDTDQGAATVQVTATVTDDWAGVVMVMCVLTPPSGSGSVAVSLRRDSGDALAGAYSGTLTLPSGSAGGAWKAKLALQDGLCNGGSVTATALEALFGAGSATVTNASLVWDSAPPQLTALSITPTEVNTESAQQTLTVTATVTDDSSGVERVTVGLLPLIGTQWAATPTMTRVSGTAHNGVFTGTMTLPQGAKEGVWTAWVGLRDKHGNEASLEADQLNELLPGAGLLVANTASAEQVTIDREWTIRAGSSSVTFPAGTVVTRQGGGRFAFYEMAAQSFVIDGSSPTSGLVGTPVATLKLGIPGLGLSFSQPVTVSLEVGDAYNGYQLSILSLDDGASAWANETSCMVVAGRVQFTVSHATKFVASRTSLIAPKPVVGGFSPASGPVGAKVTVTGSAFSDASAVTFGGIAASFRVVADGSIVATVPSGAKSGAIAVTTPGGTGVSTGRFTVARPAITRLTPTSVRRGATITLVGRYYGARRGTAYVKFGATKCKQYVSWSAARIRCKVPARAKCGRLKVVVTIGGRMSNAKTVTVRR